MDLTEGGVALRVSDEERESFLPWLFGDAAMRGEALVYAWASHVSQDYEGAVWAYWRVPSGASGFLTPEGYNTMGLDNSLPSRSLISAEALGVAVTMLALRDLAAETGKDVSELRNRYRQLAEFVVQHKEAQSILELVG